MGSLIGESSRRSLAVCLSLFTLFSGGIGWGFPLELAESPGSNLTLTVKAIKSAKNTLAINIYEFTSPEVKNAILERLQAGVQVQILEEGQPVGGFSATARKVYGEISDAMQTQNGSSHYYLMTSKGRTVKRRFRFDHAKYIVVDGKFLLIGSENYSPGGQPTPKGKGNRGWEAFLNNSQLADEYSKVFEQDIDSSYGDIVESLPDSGNNPGDEDGGDDLMSLLKDPMNFNWGGWVDSGFEIDSVTTRSGRTTTQPSPVKGAEGNRESPSANESQEMAAVEAANRILAMDADSAEKIISPETSLSGLISLIKNARSSLDIELMTFDYNWGGAPGKSPLFKAVVDAAGRGVKVRVLLNDERAFSPNAKQKNLITVQALNKVASQRDLSMSAAIADLRAMKVKIIHNKGMLVDGELTLISSINWNQNSTMNNREAAVVLRGRSVYNHYLDIFEKDWATRLEAQ